MNTIGARVAIAAVGAVVATSLWAGSGFAAHFPLQGPVIPNVEFGGLVNSQSSPATVQMACFGALSPGQKGHPMGGQTVEVFRPEALKVTGYTGSAANEIVARFGDDRSTAMVLTQFGQQVAIPTSLLLPCAGSGKVFFVPKPWSSTAHIATVSVHYTSQP